MDLRDLGEKVLVVGYTEEEEEAQRAQRMIAGRGSWQMARGFLRDLKDWGTKE